MKKSLKKIINEMNKKKDKIVDYILSGLAFYLIIKVIKYVTGWKNEDFIFIFIASMVIYYFVYLICFLIIKYLEIETKK
jgi:hypothetical protein